MVDIKKSNSYKNYAQAYYDEAILAFTIDIVIFSGMWILYFIYGNEIQLSILPLIVITVGYFILATLLHYRIAILQLIDIIKGEMAKETVQLCNFKGENSWSGWMGNSNVSKFYPKDKLVDRFRIYYLNKSNEIKFVRLILSHDKLTKIYDTFLEENKLGNIEICYLKRSKILVAINLLSNIKYNNKMEKYYKRIEKTVDQINYMI